MVWEEVGDVAVWGTKVALQDCAKCLVADDVQDHLRAMYPLWERRTTDVDMGGTVSGPATTPTDAYWNSSRGKDLLSLYRLAVQASEVGHGAGSKRTVKALRHTESMYLLEVYGSHWTEVPIKTQKKICEDFSTKLNAGQALVALVKCFGPGILLACAARVHHLAARFPPERIDALCEAIQDRYTYVTSISCMLSGIAHALLARKTVPALPTNAQICRGVQVALRDHQLVALSQEQCSTALAPSMASGRARSSMLDDPLVLDRKLRSVLSGVESGVPSINLWSAAVYRDIETQEIVPASEHFVTDALVDLHILPVLYQYRWVLFIVEPQRSTIKLLDFLARSPVCEMDLFLVSWLAGCLGLCSVLEQRIEQWAATRRIVDLHKHFNYYLEYDIRTAEFEDYTGDLCAWALGCIARGLDIVDRWHSAMRKQ